MTNRNTRSQGVDWGPFTLRIPFYHTRPEWPEFFQGVLITTCTSMAIAPILVASFGLTFEEAITMLMIQLILVCSSPILFGVPFAPGWITPAVPLVLGFVLSQGETSPERFQLMTATSLDLAAILFLLGLTGLGQRLMAWMPRTLKAGIIMGAGLGAFKIIFFDDFEKYFATPVATSSAIFVCLLLIYSAPFKRLTEHSVILQRLSSMGLLPGFLIAALIGPLFGEIQFDIQWGIMEPPLQSLWDKVAPFRIGWPGAEMYLAGLPVALMTYVILFGDIVTGTEIMRKAREARPDDKVEINHNRIYLSLGIRNALMAVTAPFCASQGILWTGVHAIIVERWKAGPEKIQTIFSAINSYYIFGIPFLIMALPLMTFLKPLLSIAFALTLIMTGFACASVAMAIPRSSEERAAVLFTGAALLFLSPWVGLALGIVAAVTLVDDSNGDRQD